MKVKGKRFDAENWVYKFSTPATMRFKPKEDYQQPLEVQSRGFLQRLRGYFSSPSETKQTKGSEKMRSKGQARLKYVKSLTNQDVLVGNEDQLDAMGLADIVQDFVDTKFHWSLNIGRPILHIAVDSKRNVIVLLPERHLLLYRFNPKAIVNKPKLEATIKLENDVRFVQVMKEGTLVLCYATGIQIYSVEEKNVRLTAQKKFSLPIAQLKLLVLPNPFQNILNIFFRGPSQDPEYFSLWNIEIEMLAKEVRMGTAMKIYDLKLQWLTKLRIQNYSKEIYLISYDRSILAARKGYVLDTATVNSTQGNNHLKYLPGQKLIHVSDFRVELYRFTIDVASNPPRISISSTDSIELPPIDSQLQYLNIVEVLGSNFALFYQTRSDKNTLQGGQIYYSFIVSSLMQREEKIKRLLPAATVGVEIDQIVEKADMVGKMGLEIKDIYLRLWNNSEKKSVEDFKLLLDTLDYDTIRSEIEKKLKKNSMSFRQVLLLEQGCLSMLANNVFSTKNSKDDIRNYLISHLLIRKLEFYKQISLIDQAEGRKTSHDTSGKLLINIQSYNNYRTMDIKTMLLDFITKHCSDEKCEALKIRALLRFFRFPLRVVYQDLLVEIIAASRKKLLKILEAIPQLLPFDPVFEQQPEDVRLFEGIWKENTVEQWQKSLYNDTVSSIDNKDNLAEVCNSVWFKRYWLTQHEFVNLTKTEIQQIHELNCSEYTFFNALDSIFDQIKDYATLRATIDFIQDRYPRMPEHLYGKIFLYRRIYEQFRENEKALKSAGIGRFRQFLRMKDEDIFRDMFIFQKIKKGFILKEMKPLYSKLAGAQVFHEGLLNYFASSQSAVSDIKYLLNRMNNQKKEFHQENEGIYQVLVRGMQLKLRLGGSQDVPIEEVLIYIENIPFSRDNPVMKDLDFMRLINLEATRFRKIGLNMTIFEMTRNIDSVIAAMVHYEIAQAKILETINQQEIKDKIYAILADIQVVNEKIFAQNQQNTLTLFSLLTKILEEQALISTVASLLIDTSIAKHFPVSKTFAQNIVLYMRKWKLTSQPSYFLSRKYLQKLSALLPEENRIRKFIEAQCILGQLLSVEGNHLMYPLSKSNSYFTSLELEEIINKLPTSQLLSLDLNNLFNAARTVQFLSSDEKIDQFTLINIHELILLRLIESGALKEAINRIEVLIQLQGQHSNNYIFPAIVAAKISPEFIQQNKQLFLKCASYLFKQPQRLLALIKQLMTVKATNNEHKNIIEKYYSEAHSHNLIYTQTNPLLDPLFRQSLQEGEKERYGQLLREILQNLLISKEQFSLNPLYHMIYVMICNDPYVLIKFFSLGKYILNFKQLRLFLSYLSRQQIFAKLPLLELGKRMFYISFKRIKQYRQLQSLINEDLQIPLDIVRQIEKFPQVKTFLLGKLIKGCQRFKLKIKSVQTDLQKRKSKAIIETDEVRLARFKQKLVNSSPREGGYEYPYLDSDNRPKAIDKKLDYPTSEHPFDTFDPKFERSIVLFRSGEVLTLYVSIELQRQQKIRFYEQKRIRENIYAELTLQKQTKKVIAEPQVELNDAVRNSVRRSRNWLKISDPAQQSPPLKLSAIDNASIQDLQEKISKISSLKASHISFAPAQETHQQELFIIQQIRKNEEKILINSCCQPQFGNTVAQSQIIKAMLGQIKQITENVFIDFTVLEQYSMHQKFTDFLRQLVQTAYKQVNISFKQALIFIRRLKEEYQQLKIKRQWLQIYSKAEQLQAKFSLQLPMKDIFKVEGLFLDSELSERLFYFLLPNIISQLADQQLLKMCKVITLSFKKSELEQEILFCALVQLLINYQRLAFGDISRQPFAQKISSLLDKLPIKLVKRRQEELRRAVGEEDLRVEVGNLLVAACQRKSDSSTALYFESKWINKRQIPISQD